MAINVTVVNRDINPATANISVDIAGVSFPTLVTTATRSVLVPAGGNITTTLYTVLGTDVKLWSTSSPHLYTANATVSSGSNADSAVTQFGVRHISFDSTHGFRLNGETIKLWGGCLHHDNGPLGAMSIDRAEERKVENLKKLGYNAIRTSHNPASPALLAACDRLGMLVMTEAFDCWAQGEFYRLIVSADCFEQARIPMVSYPQCP